MPFLNYSWNKAVRNRSTEYLCISNTPVKVENLIVSVRNLLL